MVRMLHLWAEAESSIFPSAHESRRRIQFANLPGRRVEKIAECMLLESLNRERRPPGSPLYWWALTFNGHWRTKWPALPQYRHNPWVKHSCLCCGVTQRQPSWMGSTSADWGLVALDEEDSRWCHGVVGWRRWRRWLRRPSRRSTRLIKIIQLSRKMHCS